MNTEYMLLSLYGTPTMNLVQVCDAIGMKIKTAYNRRSAHNFPIPMSGDPLTADVRDVAAYMDEKRLDATNLLQKAIAHYEKRL